MESKCTPDIGKTELLSHLIIFPLNVQNPFLASNDKCRKWGIIVKRLLMIRRLNSAARCFDLNELDSYRLYIYIYLGSRKMCLVNLHGLELYCNDMASVNLLPWIHQYSFKVTPILLHDYFMALICLAPTCTMELFCYSASERWWGDCRYTSIQPSYR